MKNVFVLLTAFSACIMLWSCNQNSSESKTTTDTTIHTSVQRMELRTGGTDSVPTGNTFIPVDTANEMLQSYLMSIRYKESDSDIRSVVFNADSLRAYLNDTSNGKIAWVRVMVAHNVDYIISGGRNRYAGVNRKAITAIISGMDANYNYVFYGNGMVMDHACPCPSSCPTIGTGASDMLPVKNGGGH